MMRKLMIATIIIGVIFAGCAKKNDNFKTEEQNGINIYSNTETPNDPTAKLDLKKLFTISSEAQTDTNAYMKRPISVNVDASNNIFVLDILTMSAKKFDNAGNFVKSIGRMGQGPGELFYPSIMFIDKDTLNIMSAASRKLSKFDLDGNFYYDKLMPEQMQLQNTRVSGDGEKIASYIVKQVPGSTDQQMPDIDFGLGIINKSDLSVKASLNSRKLSVQDLMQGKIDLNDLAIPFIPGNDFVYVSENSDNQYRVLAYDYDGKKQLEIRKDYQMIRYENKEKEEYIQDLKKMMQGTQEVKVGNFKKAIVALHADKYGRLLVYPNVDRNVDKEGVYLDIFKDGKFLNRINYEIQEKGNTGMIGMFKAQEFFIGDRLYVLNGEELKLDVYDY